MSLSGEFKFSPVKIGTDLEVFIANKDTGRIIPADNLVPGKAEPLHAHPFSEGKLFPFPVLFYDGMQAEVNTDAYTCKAYLIDELVYFFRKLNKVAESANGRILVEPAVQIDEEILNAAHDPMSRMFGCEPHLSVELGGFPEIIDIDASSHFIRYAGGHIHLGITSPTNNLNRQLNDSLLTGEGRIRVVKMLDIVLSNTFVLIEREPDRIRRAIYGKAGTYREKPYGVEYRTPSNIWARHPALTHLAWSLARIAVNIVAHGYTGSFNVPREDIINAINYGDKQLALRNFKQIKQALAAYSNYPSYCSYHDIYASGLAAFEYLAMIGLDEVLPEKNFEDYWTVNSTEKSEHSSLTPSWSAVHDRILSDFNAKDWTNFRKNWKETEVYS
jgi:hypothetical protein